MIVQNKVRKANTYFVLSYYCVSCLAVYYPPLDYETGEVKFLTYKVLRFNDLKIFTDIVQLSLVGFSYVLLPINVHSHFSLQSNIAWSGTMFGSGYLVIDNIKIHITALIIYYSEFV